MSSSSKEQKGRFHVLRSPPLDGISGSPFECSLLSLLAPNCLLLLCGPCSIHRLHSAVLGRASNHSLRILVSPVGQALQRAEGSVEQLLESLGLAVLVQCLVNVHDAGFIALAVLETRSGQQGGRGEERREKEQVLCCDAVRSLNVVSSPSTRRTRTSSRGASVAMLRAMRAYFQLARSSIVLTLNAMRKWRVKGCFSHWVTSRLHGEPRGHDCSLSLTAEDLVRVLSNALESARGQRDDGAV